MPKLTASQLPAVVRDVVLVLNNTHGDSAADGEVQDALERLRALESIERGCFGKGRSPYAGSPKEGGSE